MGVLGGAAGIKNHPWFAGFDWRAFGRREMPAPYVPTVCDHPRLQPGDSLLRSVSVDPAWLTGV